MIRDREKIKKNRKKTILFVISALVLSSIISFYKKDVVSGSASFLIILGAIFLFAYFNAKLKESSRIKKIELIFPDFLQLMTSNLRAGMTIDRAMLLSSRPEFAPLDEEILKTGRSITTGKTVESALLDMSKRIGSSKIEKIILLLISGIKTGGNLSILLEKTSVSMREREFMEKKAASNVLMYVIFIFLAVAIFSPALFSLSTILVSVLTKVLSGIPAIDSSTAGLPFTLSTISISVDFITYFSLIFIIVTDVLASLVLGLVSKGEEKEGLKYLVPILILSISIFFILRIFLNNFMAGLF
ncbi:MAG: type II secretion system F family protein [archaeon]